MKKIFTLIFCTIFVFGASQAGNPDRQGEAGAYQLLLNPWARSGGLNGFTTSLVRGLESFSVNIAGLSRISNTEISFGNTQYMTGTGIRLNAFGFAQRIGKSGTIGVTLNSVRLGDIPVTTVDQPEGTGATFSPNLFNIAVGYAHTFANKVSVGAAFRVISESTADLSASGFALDAGIQYVTGVNDEFKFGVALRNIGSPMRFKGQGLAIQQGNPSGEYPYNLTYDQRAAKFELPSMLQIGASYDIHLNRKNVLTVMGNFTSNSFSRDNISGGLEYTFNKMFTLRGGYKYEVGISSSNLEHPVHTGLAGGVSVELPVKRGSDTRLGLDYAYQVTNPFNGTHQLSLRISL